MQYNFSEGWNFVSLPCEVSDNHFQSVFPDAASNSLYSFDGAYSVETYMTPGTGYWLRFDNDTSGEIECIENITNLTVHYYSDGWQLIGSLSGPVDSSGVIDPNGIIEALNPADDFLFEFDVTYNAVSVIEPTKAYWIRLSDAGPIILQSQDSPPLLTFQDGEDVPYIIMPGGLLTLDAGSTRDLESCPNGTYNNGGPCLSCLATGGEPPCLNYNWTVSQPSEGLSLSSYTDHAVEATVPYNPDNMEYVVQLTVTDSGGLSSSHSMSIQVSDDPVGCMNPDACNYDPSATIDDGSCWNIGEFICPDPPLGDQQCCDCIGNVDDGCGVCGGPGPQYECWNEDILCSENECPDESIFGCTDQNACNYDPNVTEDDGSCVDVLVVSCWDDVNEDGYYDDEISDVSLCPGVSNNQFEHPTSCGELDCTPGPCQSDPSYPPADCMDPNACNYNPDATEDDGSCVYDLGCGCNHPDISPDDTTYTCYDDPTSPGCYNATVSLTGCPGLTCDGFGYVDEYGLGCVSGCTDPNACDYNPNADGGGRNRSVHDWPTQEVMCGDPGTTVEPHPLYCCEGSTIPISADTNTYIAWEGLDEEYEYQIGSATAARYCYNINGTESYNEGESIRLLVNNDTFPNDWNGTVPFDDECWLPSWAEPDPAFAIWKVQYMWAESSDSGDPGWTWHIDWVPVYDSEMPPHWNPPQGQESRVWARIVCGSGGGAWPCENWWTPEICEDNGCVWYDGECVSEPDYPYNPECTYPENYPNNVEDCLGQCCDGTEPECVGAYPPDCFSECGGSAYTNACDDCGDPPPEPNGDCPDENGDQCLTLPEACGDPGGSGFIGSIVIGDYCLCPVNFGGECIVVDDCGVCGGFGFDDQGCCSDPIQPYYTGPGDCWGECGGSAYLDECGVCGSPPPGAQGTCPDSEHNMALCLEVHETCGGPGSLDPMYLSDPENWGIGYYCNCECQIVDECGVCGGSGVEEGLGCTCESPDIIGTCFIGGEPFCQGNDNSGETPDPASLCPARILGCNDPYALNYDPNVNDPVWPTLDPSCLYREGVASLEDVLDKIAMALITEFDAVAEELGIGELSEQQKAISEDGLIAIGRDPETQRLVVYSHDVTANLEDLQALRDLIIDTPIMYEEPGLLSKLTVNIDVGPPLDIDILYDDNVIAQSIQSTSSMYRSILNNLSQFLEFSPSVQEIDPEKAQQTLSDKNIYELLPTVMTRQDMINKFFRTYSELRPRAYPEWSDTDEDGLTDYLSQEDEDSFLNDSAVTQGISDDGEYIDWRQEDENEYNENQSLEWFRDDLQQYFDVPGSVYGFELKEYEHRSSGYLKIRNLNQMVIVRNDESDDIGLSDWQTDGFTITMWVKFLNDINDGTLFNLGNPLRLVEDGTPEGITLETFIKNEKRYIRLIVRDENGKIRDSHFGVPGTPRIETHSLSDVGDADIPATDYTCLRSVYITTGVEPNVNNVNAGGIQCSNNWLNSTWQDYSFGNDYYAECEDVNGQIQYMQLIDSSISPNNNWAQTVIYPGGTTGNIACDSLDVYEGPTQYLTNYNNYNYIEVPVDISEWYFIVATYNPSINENTSFVQTFATCNSTCLEDPDFWRWNIDADGYTSKSGWGARCKVEIISKRDLLTARGYNVENL